MTTPCNNADDEAQIRSRLDEWTRAVRARDLNAIMASYMPNLRSFDAIGPLQFKGAETYRKHWQTCLSFMTDPMIFEIHDLDITVRDDLGTCHHLVRCGDIGSDGQEQAGWVRATTCLHKVNDTWLIAHEHHSVPFDPQTNKALLELQPDDVGKPSRGLFA